MRSWPHASLALSIAAAGLWTLFLALWGLHLTTPSEGARLAADVLLSIERGLLAPVMLVTILTLIGLRPLHAGLQRDAIRLIQVPARTLPTDSAAGPPPAAGPEQQQRSGSGRPTALPIAWGLFWLSLALSIVGFALCLLALVQSGGQGWLAAHMWFGPVLTITFALVGALVASRHPQNPIGWICSTVGVLSGLNLLAYGYSVASKSGVSLPGFQIVYWLGLWIWIPATFLPITFLLLLFPDGHLPSVRWRPIGWSAGLATAAYTLGTALHPTPPIEPNAAPNPFGVTGAGGVLDVLVNLATVLITVGAVGSVAALAIRFRRARGIERAQLKWLAYAGVMGLLGNIIIYAWSAARPNEVVAYELMLTGIMTMLFAIAAAAGIAILRYRLYAIDILINRTLVYGLLTSVVVGLYVGAVGAFDALVRSGQPLAPLLLATILTLFILRPLHAGLQRGANRLVPAPAHMAPPEPAAPAGEIPASAGVASAPGRQPPDVPENRHVLGRGTLAASLMAWGLLLLSMLLVVAGLLLGLRVVVVTQGDTLLSFAGGLINAGTITAFAVAGALVALRQPRNRIAWLFGAVGLFGGLSVFSDNYSSAGLLTGWRGFLPGLDVVRWLSNWIWIPALVLPLTFILLLFPDGRLPSARWRPVAWSAGLALAGYILVAAFSSSLGPNPFWISSVRKLEILYAAIGLLLLASSAGSVAAVIVRFRRSRGIERQQFKWLVYAAIFGFVISLLSMTLGIIWPQQTAALSHLWIGLQVVWHNGIVAPAGIAILRYRLNDIDILINRTLVYGALTTFIVVLYALVVGVSGELLHQTGSLVLSLLVTGLIAILFQPLRERLQRFVNRLMYGERDDPYAVLSRLGRQLEATLAPEAVLPTLVETIAQTLKLPYVAVALQSDGESEPQIAAAHGLPADNAVRLPLTYQSECVGELRVAPRGPGETFTLAEQRLLADIAHQAGVAVHAVRLTADIQRSRERLVTAREEERRRLRRDLHDGLGPQLASQTLTLTAAQQLLRHRPDEAEALLAAAIQHAQDAVTDIRRVVYDLRPPALDDLGLVGALRAQAAEYEASGVRFSVTVPESLPPLPAAVEVACYRIAQEALTNVVKHANARHCTVTLALDGAVHLEISDDGRSLPDNRRAGVGLTSMRERAEELGGHCLVEPAAGGGTCVKASLPMV